VDTRSSRPLILTILYIFLLAVLLLFPFNFEIPWHSVRTDVRKLPGTGGIEIASASALLTPAPPRGLYDSLVSGSGLSIEMLLSSAGGWRDARVLSYASDRYMGNILVSQHGYDLHFDVRTDEINEEDPEGDLVVEGALKPGRLRHIVLTYDFSTQRAFVDGKEAGSSGHRIGKFSNWSTSDLLVLGNDPTGNLPWLGKIFRLAIYNRPLTRSEVSENYRAAMELHPGGAEAGSAGGLVALYLFNTPDEGLVRDLGGAGPGTDLHIPEKIRVTNKRLLAPAFQYFNPNLKNLMEVAANVALLAPLGFLALLLVKGRGFSMTISCLAVLVAGAAFSLGMEVLQYFLPGRVSSMTDLVNNSAGVALGVLAGGFYLHLAAGGMTERRPAPCSNGS